MTVDPEPVTTEEEFTLATGETVMVRRMQYDFTGDPMAHVYYDIILKVGALTHISRYSSIQKMKDRNG